MGSTLKKEFIYLFLEDIFSFQGRPLLKGGGGGGGGGQHRRVASPEIILVHFNVSGYKFMFLPPFLQGK